MGLATLADVARKAEVAKSTASRALSKDPTLSIRPDTRNRIEMAAAELGFIPNPNARSLRLARSWSLAFVVPQLDNPIFGQTIDGAHHAAVARNYSILIAQVDEKTAGEGFGRRLVVATRVDGVLLNTVHYPDLLGDLSALQARVVLVNRQTGAEGEHSVLVDNEAGAALAVAHLSELGHRRIGYLSAASKTFITERRLNGYHRGLAAAGLTFEDALMERCDVDTAAAEAAAYRLLTRPERPTAIVAWNLVLAAGVTRAARRLDLTVPQQLSVIALNDSPAAEMMTPQISAVRLPLFALGAAAATQLIDLIEDRPLRAHPIILPPDGVIQRESTGPAPGL